LVLLSPAKLNLYLEVLNVRKDNYHNIRTVFERIDLSDKIILKPRPDRLIRIICSDSDVPKDKTNLCYRSAKLLQEKFNIKTGLDIGIIKRIPVGSGLGGGSSNAAGVLLGLNKIWELNLSREKLVGYAKQIGADVAFFLYNSPFAIGEGRGDKIKVLRLQRVRRFWHILVVPKITVSTALVYKKWVRGLTRPKYDVNILILALKRNGFSSVEGLLFNSLEAVTIRLYPEVKRIKERLADLGLKTMLMSGSGPAMFGIVSSRKEAVSLTRKLKKEEKSWRIFVTRTF
jgi:4-diphosphocytidyl-2-C-methyl-D-erythritol kinase